MSKDYYKILGVSKSASQDEVKRAFRELAHKHHPDKQGGNTEKFKEANEAYQVLGNIEKRKQYDQFGSNFNNMGAGGFGGGNPFGGFGSAGGANINMEDLGDIFGDFFGMGGRTRTRVRERGNDIEMNLNISFKESIFGVEKIIELYKNTACDTCNGSGAEPGTNVSRCKQCGGTGKMQKLQNTVFGTFSKSSICDKCDGEGETPDKVCKQCQGTGTRKKSISLKINIPSGINNGDTMRITGAGESVGKSGIPGDLYIHILVAKDNRFKREGNNILKSISIDFKTAVLGGQIETDVLDGRTKIKIPAGTQSGQIFRLKGKGVAGKGDLLIDVYIAVPQKLSRKQKKILEEWED